MSRKKKSGMVTIIPNLNIIDIAEEGKGVGKADELVIFVDKAVPGDVVDVKIVKKKKNFAEAVVERLVASGSIWGMTHSLTLSKKMWRPHYNV
jgi:23S rRNA (uracil1939-C5)-methyltransferase